jgi:hypothetical protein
MIKGLILALALVFAPLAGHAADGKAELTFIGEMMGFELERNGDAITGFISNMGNAHGQVKLQKVNGKWEGVVGMVRVSSGAPIMTSAEKGKFQLNTSMSGRLNFDIRLKNNELRLSGMLNNGVLLSGGLLDKGDDVVSYSNLIDMNLDGKGNGVYKGMTVTHVGGTHNWPVSTELESSGTLTPEYLAKEDHALYTLLYVLSLHLR